MSPSVDSIEVVSGREETVTMGEHTFKYALIIAIHQLFKSLKSQKMNHQDPERDIKMWCQYFSNRDLDFDMPLYSLYQYLDISLVIEQFKDPHSAKPREKRAVNTQASIAKKVGDIRSSRVGQIIREKNSKISARLHRVIKNSALIADGG